jgi:hypothetical protein
MISQNIHSSLPNEQTGASAGIDFRGRLQELVGKFADTIGYCHRFEISKPFYPYNTPNDACPLTNDPGCYIYTDDAGNPLYVGKASRYLGNRVWAHLGRFKRNDESGQLYPNADEWIQRNQPSVVIWCVAVPQEHWWLAAALEGFLHEEFFPNRSRQI